MPNKLFQQGFAPIIVLLLIVVVTSGSLVAFKTGILQNPLSLVTRTTPVKTSQESSQSAKITLQPTIGKAVTPTKGALASQSKTTVNPTPTTESSNNSNTNSNTTNTPTSTPTRPPATPTSTPTLTPTPTTVSTDYSVKILTPKGGESFKIGDTIHISWEVTGTFNTFLLSGADINNIGFNITSIENSSVRSYDWVADVGNTSQTQFKIGLIANKWPKYVGDLTVQKKDETTEYITITR